MTRGKTVGYLECTITDQQDKQIAKVNSICFISRGEQAKQR